MNKADKNSHASRKNGHVARSRFNSNRWHRVRYSLWAPVYDLWISRFNRKRRRSLGLLNLQPGERVLIIGAGTGVDLEFIDPGPSITAIDFTPAMLERLRRRTARRGLDVDARVMDGQALEFPDASFDAVILHFILAVIPDPVRCVREAARVLKPHGRAVVFDKLLPDGVSAPLYLQLFTPIACFMSTELTRSLGAILDGSDLRVVHQEAAGWKGFTRIALMHKNGHAPLKMGGGGTRSAATGA